MIDGQMNGCIDRCKDGCLNILHLQMLIVTIFNKQTVTSIIYVFMCDFHPVNYPTVSTFEQTYQITFFVIP